MMQLALRWTCSHSPHSKEDFFVVITGMGKTFADHATNHAATITCLVVVYLMYLK